MKVCIITNTYSADLIGGSNIYTNILVRELNKRNHEVIVIAACSEKDSVLAHETAKIYYFRPLNVASCSEIGRKAFPWQGVWTLLDIYNPYSLIKILKILKKEKPDLVHVHTPLDITLSSFDAARMLNLPLVFTAHDYLLLCRRVVLLHKTGNICSNENMNKLCRFYRFFVKKIVGNKADVVVFPSEFIARFFSERGFFQKTKKAVIPYPITLDKVERHQSANANGETHLNFLYVGSLSRHKGVDVLIKAFKGIGNDDIGLHIVGCGRLERDLKDLAGNDKRIEFFGKINNDEIRKCYERADVLVVPSVWNEVFGIVIMEAFRAGLPVIASRIGGMIEVVQDRHNGFLFECGNIEELRAILQNISENPGILKEMGKHAKEDVKKYETSVHMEKLISNYEEAIALNEARHHE